MLTPALQVFIQKLNKDVISMRHGDMTVTCIVKVGQPVTYQAIIRQRKKYKMPVLDNVAQRVL